MGNCGSTPPVQTFPPAPAGNSPVNGTGMSGVLPFMNAARSAGIDWTLLFYAIWAGGSVLLLFFAAICAYPFRKETDKNQESI